MCRVHWPQRVDPDTHSLAMRDDASIQRQSVPRQRFNRGFHEASRQYVRSRRPTPAVRGLQCRSSGLKSSKMFPRLDAPRKNLLSQGQPEPRPRESPDLRRLLRFPDRPLAREEFHQITWNHDRAGRRQDSNRNHRKHHGWSMTSLTQVGKNRSSSLARRLVVSSCCDYYSHSRHLWHAFSQMTRS